MFPFLIAQVTPQEIVQIQQVRELPGSLDRVLVFNSNSPELVQKEGILLSTFPSVGKRVKAAHLNFPLQGRFDIFAHHVAKAPTPNNLRSLYLGIILHNPTGKPVQVNILQGATYLSQPDAPFKELPALTENPFSKIFAGPGDRVTNAILRGQRHLPAYIVIPPRQSRMLINLPIPVKTLEPPINGRSVLMRLQSSNPVYAASLAMYAPLRTDGKEIAPTMAQWQKLLTSASLVSPRDRTPTPPGQTTSKIIYGRVAGIAQGSQWTAQIVDRPNKPYLTIPRSRQAFSYGLSTLPLGKLGTNQVQSAPLLARYPDTAYSAHGNYGIQYNLNLPLHNNTGSLQTVTVSMQTPLKEDRLSKSGLRFLNPPASQVFFRGTVRVAYSDDQGLPQTRYLHLVQKRGQQGTPLVKLNMKPQDTRLVQVNFLYPPDATPPQVLTIATLGN